MRSRTPQYPERLPQPGETSAQIGRAFRAALWIIPVGVLANVALSLAVTDRRTLVAVAEFPRGYLFLAMILGLVPWITNALRLGVWTRFVGHPLPFRETVRIVIGTELGSAMTPTASGGGLFRWGMLVARGIPAGAAASLVSLTVLEDLIFFALAVPLALLFVSTASLPVLGGIGDRLGTDMAPAALALVVLASLAALVARAALAGGFGLRMRRWGLRGAARMRRRIRAVGRDARDVYREVFRRGKWRLVFTVALTAVQWVCRYSVVSALVAFLGEPVRPVLFWLLQWIVFTLMNFVPTPGASGGAEAAFYVVYGPFLSGRVIGLTTAGWRFLTFYLQLTLGAVIFAALNAYSRRRT